MKNKKGMNQTVITVQNHVTPPVVVMKEAAEKLDYQFPLIRSEQLGNAAFKQDYGLTYAYYGGSMASGISSVAMVVALAKAGFMGAYGSGGQRLPKIKEAILAIKQQIPDRPYLVNLLSGTMTLAQEFEFVQFCIANEVPGIEASAFITVPASLVYYKLSGLTQGENGQIIAKHKIIAKISREEVAERFLLPPENKIVQSLKTKGYITEQQAAWGLQMPLADDVTVEADSGGHTDNRPLVSLFPAIVHLKNKIESTHDFLKTARVGAAGGISTPESALAAFQMGAAYVVTGSVNQACVEAGTSTYVKELLAQVKMADVLMAPSADMFEAGGKVQVTKKGTMFPLQAKKLYETYQQYAAIEEIPAKDWQRIEQTILKQPVAQVWQEIERFFSQSDPKQLALAEKNPKHKMGLVFRWYLGNASRWAIDAVDERKMDMQIWCGQAMGAFNNWCEGTPLAQADNRFVADVAKRIMDGAAQLQMKNLLSTIGISGQDQERFLVQWKAGDTSCD